MDALQTLAEKFLKFPGVGPRQAKRFVYHLLSRGPAEISALEAALAALKKASAQCPHCFRFYPNTGSVALCPECSDKGRDPALMMAVERDTDLDAIRASDAYRGRFFVLGGSLPFLEQEPAKKIRIRELLTEVERAAKEDGLREIILATSANAEGEHTALYISKTLESLLKKYDLQVTALGRGLSTGAELEYADKETLKNALKNRG
ncbi:MAG: hypothetical protein A2675_03565 [Candidatus Yonathbacteria bacterium RIFCSPHIGHO2_01_FULL_51_10]|uniref:Recombination protein RecR n=1 Tax=Candidatus Yonathbacteria bacterium RIFCSPHIGHO2_01_FULL_51_10 TaxID=1802723 RepID=A0A1G2S9W4_9BACT|nr:MAG: hypothetical protein A2675_03565 [Candidatus Yonathbacteria bacterium RIFCSPHIGHO2_01_FULL_51_10]